MKINEYYIESEIQLRDFCEKIKTCKEFAIDTEFVRTNTYFPIPCLLQIATRDHTAIVDLTRSLDLSSLKTIFSKSTSTLIIHAFRQDLEILKQIFSKTSFKFFDTQIAEMFLGENEPPSYGKLVEKYFDINLKKSSQYSDWQKRPLSPEQLSYAFLDVKYLIEIYTKQVASLKKERKFKYYTEEMTEQSHNFENLDDETDAVGFYGHVNSPEKLFITEFICKKRIQRAIRDNRPKARVLHNKSIINFLQSLPREDDIILKLLEDIEKLEGIKFNTSNIEKYKSIKKTAEQYRTLDKELVKALQDLLEQISKKHKISKQLLASKSDLQKLILDHDNNRLVKGWRKKIFGEIAINELKSHE